MKFATIPIAEASGAILAHGVRHAGGMLKKGRLLSQDDIAALKANDIQSVVAARLDGNDVAEDEAARALALAVAGDGTLAQQAFTGRANVHAKRSGIAVIDESGVKAINHIDESLTIATLAPYAVVSDKQMVATIKVIPFACPRQVLEQALEISKGQPLLRVQPFIKKMVSLIVTTLPQTKDSVIAKTEEVTRGRLEALGLSLGVVVHVAHHQQAVREAVLAMKAKGSDLTLVFGASAIVDRADVIPAAVVEAGGRVVHLGMPVDPGNLLMMGEVGDVPVIGVPSCARSPKRNGFDWVLERCCAGLKVSREDLMDMGSGGLLAEISSRPLPRESKTQVAPRVVAIVLAAGTSSRMGSNKMLADFDGKPMVRASVANVLSSGVDEVIVVSGHEPEKVRQALAGLAVRIVNNPDYAAGLSTSLRAGVEAAGQADAVVVCLADMPRVSADVIDRMVAAFNPVEHRSIVVPVHQGQFGNPVLWGSEHFARLKSMSGDKGARALIGEMKSEATEIVADEGVLMDADTPEALAHLKSAAKTGS
jgi:molybdenum cofactor cytidylyltransferase